MQQNGNDEWTGDRVRRLRKQLKMSQSAFGQEIWDAGPGTAQTNVSRIERGEISPSASVRRTLQRLERAAETGEVPFQTVMGYDIEGVGEKV